MHNKVTDQSKHFTNDKSLFSHLFCELHQIMIYQLKFKVYGTLSFNLPYLRLINLSNYMVALNL